MDDLDGLVTMGVEEVLRPLIERFGSVADETNPSPTVVQDDGKSQSANCDNVI